MKLLVRQFGFEVILSISKGEIAESGRLHPQILNKAKNIFETWKKEKRIDFYLFNPNIQRVFKRVQKNPFKQLPENYKFMLVVGRGARIIPEIKVESSLYDEFALDVKIDSNLKNLKVLGHETFYLNILRKASEEGLGMPGFGHCLGALTLAKSGKKFRVLSIAPEGERSDKPYSWTKTPGQGILMLQVNKPIYLLDTKKRRELVEYIQLQVGKIRKTQDIKLFQNLISEQLTKASHGIEAFLFEPVNIFCGFATPKKKPKQVEQPITPPPQRSGMVAQPVVMPFQMQPQNFAPQKAGAFTKKGSTAANTNEAMTSGQASFQEHEAATTASTPSASTSNQPQPTANEAHPASIDSDGESQVAEETEMTAPPPLLKPPASYNGKGILEIEVAEDNMSATIINFKDNLYEDTSLDLDPEWLENELRRLNIVVRDEDLLKRCKENLAKKRPLNSLKICAGYEGLPPTGPTLVALDPPAREEDKEENEEEGTKDLRKSTIKTFKKGERFAEFRFEEQGENGWDIFGKVVAMPEPELPSVTIEEGAEATLDHAFKALQDGLAEVDPAGKTVKVTRTYLVKGDVNLITGNIEFNGSVVVTGFIRDKAVVKCTESLHVVEGITDGYGIAKGGVKVEGGIVNSSIQTEGSVEAKFIEGSHLTVDGNIKALQSITNASVMVGGNVSIESLSGMFAGGKSYVSGNLSCGHLGFESNADTHLTMGASWVLCKRLAVNKTRQDKFEKLLDETERTLKTHTDKRAAQLTDKHKEHMTELKKKVKKLKSIVKNLKSVQVGLKIANADQNEGSEVIIRDTLHPTVTVYLGKTQVNTKSPSSGVKIDFIARNNSHIHILEEGAVTQIPKDDKQEADGAGETSNEDENQVEADNAS